MKTIVESKLYFRILAIMLFHLIQATTPSKKFIRIANFFGKNKTISVRIRQLPQLGWISYATLENQEMSEYKLIIYTGADPVEIEVTENGEVKPSIFNQVSLYQRQSITFYISLHSSSIKITQKSDDLDFPFPMRTPFSADTLWRVIDLRSDIDPGKNTVYTNGGGCKHCGWVKRKEFISTHYLLASSSYYFDVKIANLGETGEVTERTIQRVGFYPEGVYSLILLDHHQMKLSTEVKGKSYFGPVLVIMIFPFILQILRLVINKILKKKQKKDEDNENPSLQQSDLNQSLDINREKDLEKTITSGFKRSDNPHFLLVSGKRIRSLDILKGIGIITIIFADAGGGNYIFFSPSIWDGITFTDFTEPILVFSLGFTTIYSHLKAQNPQKRGRLIVSRILALVFFGLIYENKTNDLTTIIFTGLFQRLAACYAVLNLMEFILPLSFERGKTFQIFKTTRFWVRSSLMLLIPLTSMLLVYQYPVPNCPKGYQGPGGLDQNKNYEGCTGGAARAIDIAIFGESHLSPKPRCKTMYLCESFDEYGMLGTMNFIFSGFLGTIAGLICLAKKWRERVTGLFKYSIILFLLTFVTWVLDHINKDKKYLSVNKTLWSLGFVFISSYVVLLTLIVLMVCFQCKWYGGWPYLPISKNSVFLLFGSKLLLNRFPFGFENSGGLMEMSLSNTISCVLWMFVGLLLHKFKFYVKF